MSNDYWDISNLIARYAELLNLGRIDEVGDLFRYGRITGEGNPNVYEGTEGVTAMYRESVHFGDKVPDTLIFTTNLQIWVDGDAATSRAYFMAVHQANQDSATPNNRVEPVLAGRYHDEFRRIDGKWWFHHRHMISDLLGDLSTHLRQPMAAYMTESRPHGERD